MLPQKKKKPAGSNIQANTKNSSLKFAFAFSAVLAIAAAGAMAQETVLKGKILKELNAKPNADLVDRYGEAATDPAIADALRKAQGKTNTAEAKTRADAYEALQHGVWTAGADPTMAIMNGFVPPNMSPEQATIMSRYLPKMPRMPHLMSPEQMAGEPNPDMFLPGNPEPMSPYIPIPDSVATRQPRTRQLPLIPGPLSAESFIGGLGTPPHMMGVPIMPYGAGRQAIKEANQRQIEDYLRDRFGPGYPSPFQKNHNKPIPATKPAEGHIAESDHQSVVGICDENGNEITSIQYDPWGQHTVLSGGSVMPDRMYKGMFYHDRSQNYLTLHRVYNPKLGRWLSRDPLGEAAGTNLYAYCGNDPINRWDPLGLSFADSGGGEAGIGPGGSLGSPVDNPVGAKCLSQCASKFPILGPLLVAGGLPIIPVSGKLGGAIQGTSIISSGLRASPLGGVSIPPTWAPTATFPFNQTTTNLGGALGRWAPIVGGVLTAAQYADFMNCLQDCENDNSGSSCQR